MASLQELYAVSKAMGADKRAANPLASGMDAFGSGVSQGYGQDSGMERAYKIMQIKNAADQIKKRQEDMELKQMQFELTKKKTELDIASTQQEMENQSTLSKLYQQQQKGFSNTQGVDPKGIHTEQSKIAQMVDTEGRRTGEMARHYQDLPVREVGISDGKYKMTEKKKKALPKPTQSGIQTTAVVDGQIVPVPTYNKDTIWGQSGVSDAKRNTLLGALQTGIYENPMFGGKTEIYTQDEAKQFLQAQGYANYADDPEIMKQIERYPLVEGDPIKPISELSDFDEQAIKNITALQGKTEEEAIGYIMEQHGKTEEEARAIYLDLNKGKSGNFTPQQEDIIQANMKHYNRPREEVIQALKSKGKL